MDLTKNLALADAANNNHHAPQQLESKPRYVVRDAAFALQFKMPLSWIVDGLIRSGSVSVFYGEPGSKKTYAMIHMAVCVALGKKWLGFDTQQVKVLFVDEESGEHRFSLRLGAALRGEFGGETAPIEFVSLAGFKLDNLNDVTLLEDLIISHEAELVIVDALADVMDGDENSKQDTQPVMNALRRMTDSTGAAFVVIHHSNKGGNYRGSSAIKGSVDLMVLVDSEDNSKLIKFRSVKNRDGETKSWSALATWTDDQFYLSAAEPKGQKRRAESEVYVLNYLLKNGASFLEDIKSHAEICTPDTARKAATKLLNEGLVVRVDPGRKGTKAVFEITPKGEEVIKMEQS